MKRAVQARRVVRGKRLAKAKTDEAMLALEATDAVRYDSYPFNFQHLLSPLSRSDGRNGPEEFCSYRFLALAQACPRPRPRA